MKNFKLLLLAFLATIFAGCNQNPPIIDISLNKTSLILEIGATEQLTVTFKPKKSTDENLTWLCNNSGVVTVEDGLVTANAKGVAIVTVKTTNGKIATCEITVYDALNDEGVVINGLRWATRNVNTPNKFAVTPESIGMYYQWNSNIGWSSTNPIYSTNGDNKYVDYSSAADLWTEAKNPCPNGWRVPTINELLDLLYYELDGSIYYAIWTSQNGVNGVSIGTEPNQIFLPAAGYRTNISGEPISKGTVAHYWSSNLWTTYQGRFLGVQSTTSYQSEYPLGGGLPIRCIKK